MYIEMTVFGFTLDDIAGRPVVILKDAREGNTIPIWISATDAVALAAELVFRDGSAPRRSRDLMSLFLERTGTEIGAIIIEGVANGDFSASVKFLQGGGDILVDVRPCEAIVAALKYKMPILVSEEVLQRASVVAMNDEELADGNNARRFVEFLDSLDPATLGKYPM
jgi:bifunctional DNase/RNase